MVMERLDAAGKHPENQDKLQQGGIKLMRHIMRTHGIKDPGPKVDRLPSATKPKVQDIDPLASVIETYQNQPHTPELVTQTHQAIWQARGELIGTTYEVTPCPYTQEELADVEANGKRIGYLPVALATQQSRHVLGEMFPKMQSHSVKKGNSVTNNENPSGWFDYEAAVDAPYLDTEEGQLMDRMKKDGRTILSLNQYIVAGQDSKLFTGQYLEEIRTRVRLGSRDDGRVVDAGFSGDGRLSVGWYLKAVNHVPFLGGRSSGMKKA
ncbi:hypothetical protein A3G16_01300 [Candidatus Curtissbacteria bacterium RIFCSPLOWO2_12_FULL_41_16]|nr:MAG: hypothetical protein A3G16_01300 [Candidatus Curtissbacteria bacterium RIFCSPLOWO2_12_FULL_41_16]